MNRSVSIVFVLAFLTTSCIIIIQPVEASADSWVTRAPMPTARFAFGAAAVNGVLYAIGGIVVLPNGVETTTNVNEAYDIAGNSWVEKAPMPSPNWLDSFGIAVYQNKIYCIGGPANNVYDPATDTWETKTPMPTQRHFLDANFVEGKIYLIGGLVSGNYGSYSLSGVNEVYDPVTDSWTEEAPIPYAVASYASAVVDNKIYVISGCSSSDITNSVQVYDPQTDKWSAATPIPVPVENAAAGAIINTATPNAIYVVGGSAANNRSLSQNFTQVYFPDNDSWSVGSPIIANTASLSIVVVNDSLYAIGGTNWGDPNPILSSIYQYLPNKYTVPTTPSPSSSPAPTNSSPPSPSSSPSPTLTPLPSIPEFPSWIVLPLAIITVLSAVMAPKRNRNK